ncbi:MAG: bifunctional phosphoglucose/phosphomannose isomerase [Candidatus Heimdallarchaeaceae archaeon]
MIDLDDVNVLRALDKSNQLALMNNWTSSITELKKRLHDFSIPEDYSWKDQVVQYTSPEKVLLCGMGGSAIVADYVSNLLIDEIKVPIIVNKSYSIPKFVDEKTLTICISYSGNTEETVSCFYQALKRKSMIVTISSGGILGDFSSKIGIPYVKLKGGQPPRTAFPLLYVSLLKVFEKIFSITNIDEALDESVALLERLSEQLSPEVSTSQNQAKKLSLLLYNSTPIFISNSYCSPVSYRAKCQLIENSKMLSCYENLPESNHNGIVIWDSLKVMNHISVVLLRLPNERPEIKTRVEVTEKIMNKKTEKIFELYALGNSKIAHQLTLTYIIDYISIYLAFLNEIDPTVIDGIDLLKKTLTKKHGLLKNIKELLQD